LLAKVQMNNTNGRSKGWGKVAFASVEESDRARLLLNRTVLDERKVSVRFDAKGAGFVRPPESKEHE